ncbi:hypothetical protein, partial [Escherichia coli]|uniref:hypothetical protein n=1 Tax=Escherichia coli TaxID=562 RepID=UPI001A7E3F0C
RSLIPFTFRRGSGSVRAHIALADLIHGGAAFAHHAIGLPEPRFASLLAQYPHVTLSESLANMKGRRC